MNKNSLVIVLLFILLFGCSKTAQNLCTVPAMLVSRNENYGNVEDSEIIEIFGTSPAAGIPPRQISWSNDSNSIAYIRDVYDKKSKHRSELWFHNIISKTENPIFSEIDISVESYSWSGSSRLIVAAGGDLYAVELNGKKIRLTHTAAEERNPIASPDGSRVVFIRDFNIYAIDLVSQKETQITEGGSIKRLFGEVPSIYSEEFKSIEGMSWSSDSQSLWFYDVDLANVSFRTLTKKGSIIPVSYPYPGEPNPIVRIASVNFSSQISSISYLDTGADPNQYLPRVLWHQNAKQLFVMRLDRLQTVLETWLCPINEGPCSNVITERDPRFVNLLSEPALFPDGKKMLFLSERDGYSHIYQIGTDGTGLKSLTGGRWTVNKINLIDLELKKVVFTANAENELEQKLYRISLEGERELESIDMEEGTHDVLYSPNGSKYIDNHSALNRSPKTDIREADGKHLGVLAAHNMGSYRSSNVRNDLLSIKTSSGFFNALLTRPINMQEGKKYPVIIIMYGGPHVQLARNYFHPIYQPFRELLARRGILVFTLDGRGSSGRGHSFEAQIRLALGQLELEDQMAGVEYLKALPFVDSKRIGVFGWSYGGFLALSAMLRTDALSMGIAVAPVTDWKKYNSAYTERYMQTPLDNPNGYEQSALLPLVSNLKKPLFLAHGMSDDNVLFVHSSSIFEAFLSERKNITSLFLPNQDHSINDPKARLHLFHRIMQFIKDSL